MEANIIIFVHGNIVYQAANAAQNNHALEL